MTQELDPRLFRRLVDAVQDYAIVMLDPGGRVSTWNRGAEEGLGYPAAQALGRHFSFLDAIPDGREERAAAILRSAAERGRHESESLLVRGDGSHLRANVSITALQGEQGAPIGFSLIARDITLQDEVGRRLQRHLTMLEAIVENIPHMIFVKEAGELRFQRFNRAAEDLLGIPRQEMLGRNDYDFFPEEQAEFFVRQDRRTLDEGRMVDIPEEPIMTRQKGARWLHTRKVPLVDAEGRPEYLLGISEDITAQKEAQECIRELTAELERKVARLSSLNRELEAISECVSHDLRAPLRGIDGISYILLEEYGDSLDDTGKRYLELVRGGSQQMARLIDGLLSLSHLTRSTMVWEPVDLSAMARQIVDALREQEAGREVEVVIQDDLRAEGDPRLLRTALHSLLSNAWKFTARSPSARIEFGALDEGNGPEYFVKDNGAGFDMAFSGKLFKAFQRLHHAGEFEGTGIGLATVSRIIQRHEGEVWAEGAPGKGAVFHFKLGRSRRPDVA